MLLKLSLKLKKEWPKNLISILVKDKVSTHYYFAGETRLGYQEKKWGAQLIIKRIDPGYQSMGAYFFQHDIQEYSFANNFKLDSGKLSINTNIGFQKDLSAVPILVIFLRKNLASILISAIMVLPIIHYPLQWVMNYSSK